MSSQHKRSETRLQSLETYREGRARKSPAYRRARGIESRKYLYGLLPEQYDEMLIRQSGLCALCDQALPLHVDHDHKSGCVRGLLCLQCNTRLHVVEDTAYLNRASAYLENKCQCPNP